MFRYAFFAITTDILQSLRVKDLWKPLGLVQYVSKRRSYEQRDSSFSLVTSPDITRHSSKLIIVTALAAATISASSPQRQYNTQPAFTGVSYIYHSSTKWQYLRRMRAFVTNPTRQRCIQSENGMECSSLEVQIRKTQLKERKAKRNTRRSDPIRSGFLQNGRNGG